MRIVKTVTLRQDGYYNTFPTVTRLEDGTLIALFRQADNTLKKYGQATHIDPSAKVVKIVSTDSGETWGEPATLFNDEMSEQDPCLNKLSDGTLIASCFRWKVVPLSEKESLGELFVHFGRKVLNRWAAVLYDSVTIRSYDSGKTWDTPRSFRYSQFVSPLAIRGNILESGENSIIAPFYGIKAIGQLASCVVARSHDHGLTWDVIGEVPGEEGKNYLEPYLYRTPSNRLAMLIRTQKDFKAARFDETYLNLHISFSDDEGKSWSLPKETAIFSPNPVHLLELPNRALLTFGLRKEPVTIQGVSVDKELTELNSGTPFNIFSPSGESNSDLGYSWGVQLSENRAFIVYYFTDREGRSAIGGALLEE